jgi:hypothetical protein
MGSRCSSFSFRHGQSTEPSGDDMVNLPADISEDMDGMHKCLTPMKGLF